MGKGHEHGGGGERERDHAHDHANAHAHDHASAHAHDHANTHAHDHGHDHGHGHDHRHGQTSSIVRLQGALALTVSFFVVEVIAGIATGSLALLSDAAHMLTDSGALALALFAQRIAGRARTTQHTFGFRRAEVLAALVNGLVLIGTAVFVLLEAIQRVNEPPEIHGMPMLIVASLGLFVNLGAAFILGHGAHESNANVRAALLHVLSDAAGSVAAIVASVLILTMQLNRADAVASILIALLILVGAARLVQSTLSVLMEGVPANIDLRALEAVVRETPGVTDAHDLHAWSISDQFVAVMVHVVLDGKSHGTEVSKAVGARIKERFGIEHVTVQPEAPSPTDQLVSAEQLIERSRQKRAER